jgi:hypothetical protein
LKSLSVLDLKGARVTEAGYKKLQAALPRCKIEWDDPDRAVAEWVLKLNGGSVEIVVDGRQLSVFGPNGKLPEGPFRIEAISLRGLLLPAPGLTDATLDGLRRVIELHRLALMGSQITDAGLEKLATYPGLSNLEGLSLEGSKFGNGGMAHLKRFTKLNAAHVYGPVTGEGLVHLKAIPALKNLLVSSTEITDTDLAVLPGWPLEALDIRGRKLTRAAEPHLAKLGRLKSLGLGLPLEDEDLRFLENQTELVHLNLATRMTNDGLRMLGGMKKLKDLRLSGPITDDGLEHIAALNSLTFIHLSASKVTEAGVKKLAVTLPACRIRWNDITIEPTKKP